MSALNRLFSNTEGPAESCFKCGKSENVKLICRSELSGCELMTFTYCRLCINEIIAEEKAIAHQRENFCNICNIAFKRPRFKNRKKFIYGRHYTSYALLLCSDCYRIESANLMIERESLHDEPKKQLDGDQSELW